MKIIAALDGLKLSTSTAQYATEIAKKMNAHLVAIFLDDLSYNSYKVTDLVAKGDVSEKEITRNLESDRAIRQHSVAVFEDICRAASINYSIHHDKNIASQELLHESIYADLLIIGRHETLTHFEEPVPTRFVRDILSGVQCPVLLVPAEYRSIEKVIMLYDGAPPSVYAIKMLYCVLPVLTALPSEVITVKDIHTGNHVFDNRLIKEYVKRHTPHAMYTVLQGDAASEIIDHVKMEHSSTVLVLGGYQRGAVSRWFRPSMADLLMRSTDMPLFVAHNK